MTDTISMRDAVTIARDLMREHLDASWSFDFDYAKRRAGVCRYMEKRISVSRYFVVQATAEEFRQVMLHEIAHALSGATHGHGPVWRKTARSLGYTGKRTLEKSFAADHAPWVGICPGGHEFHRFRRPPNPSSCKRCSRSFNARFTIEWRFVPPELRGSTG